MFSRFLNKQKEANGANMNSAFTNMAPISADDSMLATAQAPQVEKKRRWSYVTYLDKGTLHGDGDNLMVGL